MGSQTSREKIKINKKFNDFFIAHHKEYMEAHPEIINTMDTQPKRIVFISIYCLFRTWKQCPTMRLYNSIFLLPLKREWVDHLLDIDDQPYEHEFHALLEDVSFLTLLRWKMHQNLAIFLSDNEREKGDDNDVIAPVWRRISRHLQTLHDPLNLKDADNEDGGGKYQALIFDEDYWEHESTACKKNHEGGLNMHLKEFCVTWKDVIRELCIVTLCFATMKVILQESNSTLDVLTSYCPKYLPAQESKVKDGLLDVNWWMADDYYDIEIVDVDNENEDEENDDDDDEKYDESSEIP